MDVHTQNGASIFAEKLHQSDAKNKLIWLWKCYYIAHSRLWAPGLIYIVTNRSFLVLFICF